VPVRLAPGEISRCELGASLGDQGFVETSKLAFASREPLYVSMWLNEAPQALQVSAHLLDARGREVAVVRKAAQGSQVATLKFDRKLKAGKYKLEGYWGGNLGCEKSVEVN